MMMMMMITMEVTLIRMVVTGDGGVIMIFKTMVGVCERGVRSKSRTKISGQDGRDGRTLKRSKHASSIDKENQ